MSNPSAHPLTIVDLVIPHVTQPQVLLVSGTDGWCLPRWTFTHEVYGNLDAINRAVHQRFGLSATILRMLAGDFDETLQQSHLTYVLENQDLHWAPPSAGRWIGRSDLVALLNSAPDQGALLESYLVECESGVVPAQRTPWAHLGWFAEATGWFERQLSGRGEPALAPIEQLKSSGISCILRAQTAARPVYFKSAAALPLFVNEPMLLTALAARFSQQIPMPLAVDLQRRWMLLADFGSVLAKDDRFADRLEMVRRFGQIQVVCTTELDELLALGCHDRRPLRLAAQLDELLLIPEALAGLSDIEREGFQRLAPALKERCRSLAEGEVPSTLVHGDLHLNNVAVQDEFYWFFDWTDACIAHPFLDMMVIYDQEEPAAQAELRDAYLALWEPFAPYSRLLELWRLARPLSDLHQLISYHHIVANLEPAIRADFAEDIPRYLRKILQVMQEETDATHP